MVLRYQHLIDQCTQYQNRQGLESREVSWRTQRVAESLVDWQKMLCWCRRILRWGRGVQSGWNEIAKLDKVCLRGKDLHTLLTGAFGRINQTPWRSWWFIAWHTHDSWKRHHVFSHMQHGAHICFVPVRDNMFEVRRSCRAVAKPLRPWPRLRSEEMMKLAEWVGFCHSIDQVKVKVKWRLYLLVYLKPRSRLSNDSTCALQ